ncbi:hypothetical protein D9M73_77370 [compost metagenome]
MWVHPFGKVAAVFQFSTVDQVAVGQQHRVLGAVGAQGHGVHGHDVGAIEKIGDAPETLGLALRKEGVVADVETHQLGVFGRAGGGENLQLELIGQVVQHQLLAFHLEGCALAIDQHAGQVELFTIKLERLHRQVRVAAQLHLVEHARFGRVQVKTQVDGVYPVGGCGVVGAVNRHGGALPGSTGVKLLQHGYFLKKLSLA